MVSCEFDDTFYNIGVTSILYLRDQVVGWGEVDLREIPVGRSYYIVDIYVIVQPPFSGGHGGG